VFSVLGVTTTQDLWEVHLPHDRLCGQLGVLTLRQTLRHGMTWCPTEAAYLTFHLAFAAVSFYSAMRQAYAYHRELPPRAVLDLMWSLGGLHSAAYGVCTLAYTATVAAVVGFDVALHLPRLLVAAETLALGAIASRPHVRIR
jgi:hypothetical protein